MNNTLCCLKNKLNMFKWPDTLNSYFIFSSSEPRSYLEGQDHSANIPKICPGHNSTMLHWIWIIFHTVVVHDPMVCHNLESRSYLQVKVTVYTHTYLSNFHAKFYFYLKQKEIPTALLYPVFASCIGPDQMERGPKSASCPKSRRRFIR